MQQAGRVIVSLVIWIGMFSVLGSSLTSAVGPVQNMNSGELLGLVAIFMLGAAIATAALWTGNKETAISVDERRSKTKRAQPTRVQRLIDDLDDDEVYELETLLLSREDQQNASTKR